MTVQECYEKMGGNYDEIMERLPKESLIEKFMLKFPADESMNGLRAAVAEGNIENSFRMAHTLKGVCENLAFTQLGKAASALTEQLRSRSSEADRALYEAVEQEYKRVIDTITEYSAQ